MSITVVESCRVSFFQKRTKNAKRYASSHTPGMKWSKRDAERRKEEGVSSTIGSKRSKSRTTFNPIDVLEGVGGRESLVCTDWRTKIKRPIQKPTVVPTAARVICQSIRFTCHVYRIHKGKKKKATYNNGENDQPERVHPSVEVPPPASILIAPPLNIE